MLIDKHINACRLVYNIALETKIYAYKSHGKNLTTFDLINQLPELKKECPWMKSIYSHSLQQSIIDLGKAFTYFFNGRNKFPKFKKKSCTISFRNPEGEKVKVLGNKIYFPKFNEGIKFLMDRTFSGKIKNSIIIKTPTGKYFISLMVDIGDNNIETRPIKKESAIGIDLGIKDLIVTSNGNKTENPKYLKKKLERLKVLQRRLRNKKNGSNNKRKAYKKISLLHEKVTNQRNDFLHKQSTQLINNHDTLCLEDLKVKNMLKNHHLAQSISDAGWSRFVEICKYKGEWYGKNILQISTFEPSTKRCSACGVINNDLTLANREWKCKCGAKHDRDINAAINIKNYCLRNSGKGTPGAPVEMLAKAKSKKQEVKQLITLP